MAVSAHQLLRLGGHPARFVRAAVFDPNGRYAPLATALLPFAADVRVVTRRPAAYAAQERLAMEGYGAALPVTSDFRALDGTTLILPPTACRASGPGCGG